MFAHAGLTGSPTGRWWAGQSRPYTHLPLPPAEPPGPDRGDRSRRQRPAPHCRSWRAVGAPETPPHEAHQAAAQQQALCGGATACALFFATSAARAPSPRPPPRRRPARGRPSPTHVRPCVPCPGGGRGGGGAAAAPTGAAHAAAAAARPCCPAAAPDAPDAAWLPQRVLHRPAVLDSRRSTAARSTSPPTSTAWPSAAPTSTTPSPASPSAALRAPLPDRPLAHHLRLLPNGIGLPEDAPKIGEIFRDAGWSTGYTRRHMYEPPQGVRRRGRRATARCPRTSAAATTTGSLNLSSSSPPRPTKPRSSTTTNPSSRPPCRRRTDAAIRFVAEKAASEEPFFLFLSFIEPHHQNRTDDYPAPDGYRERYTTHPWLPPICWSSRATSTRACRGIGADQAAKEHGRLQDGLKSLGLLDDTIMIQTCDHVRPPLLSLLLLLLLADTAAVRRLLPRRAATADAQRRGRAQLPRVLRPHPHRPPRPGRLWRPAHAAHHLARLRTHAARGLRAPHPGRNARP